MTDMNHESHIRNPLVTAYLFEDGEAVFEIHGETGGVVHLSFTEPERLYGIAKLLERTAFDSRDIRDGIRDFADVAPEYGGIKKDEKEEPLTTNDIEWLEED